MFDDDDDDEDGDGGDDYHDYDWNDITVVMIWTCFISRTMYFCRYTNILTYVGIYNICICGVWFQKAFGD